MSKSFILFLCLLGAGFLWFKLWAKSFEQKAMYYPETDWPVVPSDHGMQYRDIALQTTDGATLHAWYVPGTADAAFTVLFLHGNAGNVCGRIPFMTLFRELGLSTLLLDYRGYGKSLGKPSEQGLYRDADAAYDYLTGTLGIAPQKIIVFGESLGGAVAIDLASRKPVGALICESTFSRVLDLAAWHHPYMPARLMVSQKFDSLSKIGRVQAPKYFVHSPYDEVVPYSLGMKLFEAAPEPKQFFKRSGAHCDIEAGDAIYRRIVEDIRQYYTQGV